MHTKNCLVVGTKMILRTHHARNMVTLLAFKELNIYDQGTSCDFELNSSVSMKVIPQIWIALYSSCATKSAEYSSAHLK